MKNKHIFIPLFVFLGAGVVSLIASIIDYTAINPALAYSSETIQFNYDGASDGLDPNGNLFDPVGFLNDEVIENALAKSELTYSVDDVRPYIAMENVVPQNILEEITSYEEILASDKTNDGGRNITSKDYHPVRYRFVVYHQLDNKLSKAKLNEFVDNIVDEYNASFYETYKKSFTENMFEDIFDMDGYDYIYQSQIYVSKLRVLMNYANEIYQEHDDFIINVDGVDKSFKDLYLKAEFYINTDSSKINNLIINNALSKDVDRLKDYYNYLINLIDYDINKYSSDLDSIKKQIGIDTSDPSDDYKINPTVYVGTGENVIKVQDETVATYNTLMNRQISVSNTIAFLAKQKAEYENILDTISHASGDATAEARVQEMLAKLGTDYQELDAFFNKLIEEYNAKYLKEGVVAKSTLKYNSASVISSGFIVRAIKIAAPIMLATMFGIAVFYIVWVIRKDKKVA